MKKQRSQIIFFFALIAAMLLIVSSVGAAPKDGPVVSLSTAQDKYGAGQDVLITVSISNLFSPGLARSPLQWLLGQPPYVRTLLRRIARFVPKAH